MVIIALAFLSSLCGEAGVIHTKNNQKQAAGCNKKRTGWFTELHTSYSY